MERDPTAAPHGGGTTTGEAAHELAVYDSPDMLVTAAATFLAPALETDGTAILVASASHRPRIEAALRRRAGARGRLIARDAEALLADFMVGDTPDPTRFRTHVGALLRGVEPPVRIWGEMVAVLWEAGNLPAVIAVEEYWNDLLADHGYRLLCAYPRDTENASEAFQAIRDRHTGVAPAAAAPARERDEFLAMVIHDIRSPIAMISGLLRELQEGRTDLTEDEVTEFLALAQKHAGQIQQLTADLLTIAQGDAGSFSVQPQPLDLVALVRDISRDVRDLTRRPIAVTADDGLPRAFADPARQMQILTNLLTNAVKFSPSGSPIDVTVTVTDDRLRVCVCDRGDGIPQQDLAALFKPFSRLKVGQVTGNGLGLHVARALVEAQGGRIWVESTPGEGSTFTYTVPAADD